MPAAPAALLDLEAACGDVVDLWAGALLGASLDAESDVGRLSDDGLVRVIDALARLARRVETLQARCAAGLAERSRGGIDGSDLARRHGYASPERLIAQATGGRYTDAARLVAVGQATSQRASFTGAPLPARHPQVASALEAGTLCVAAAEVIRRFLDGLARGAGPDELEAAEQLLVDRAPVVGVDGLARLIKQLEAHLDPDGVKPREDELRSRRSLSVWQDAAGMINLRGAFDPANGAPIKLAIETLVGAELHQARDGKRPFGSTVPAEDGSTSNDAALSEERTIAQMNADALADIARLSPLQRRRATRAPLDDGRRSHRRRVTRVRPRARDDRRHRPADFGGERTGARGLGRHDVDARAPTRRGARPRSHRTALHSRAEDRARRARWRLRLARMPPPALAHPGAPHRLVDPGSRTHGPVQRNSACSHHHHRVHDDGWGIDIRDGRSWFLPPPHVDPERQPRAGNIGPGHIGMRSLGARLSARAS